MQAFDPVVAILGATNVGLQQQLRDALERAAYWKQRAKAAEGHLYGSDLMAAARDVHQLSLKSGTSWESLSAVDRFACYRIANRVLTCVNARRDARRPKDSP
jgi:hypothetical protein